MDGKEKRRLLMKQRSGVRCQGCAEKIDPDEDLSDVEYVRTKRGSEWFFHTGCMHGVWKRKIC